MRPTWPKVYFKADGAALECNGTVGVNAIRQTRIVVAISVCQHEALDVLAVVIDGDGNDVGIDGTILAVVTGVAHGAVGVGHGTAVARPGRREGSEVLAALQAVVNIRQPHRFVIYLRLVNDGCASVGTYPGSVGVTDGSAH